jgi:hypothetical protein
MKIEKEQVDKILHILKLYADLNNWEYEWGTFVAGDGKLSIEAKACKWTGPERLAPWAMADNLLSEIDWSVTDE